MDGTKQSSDACGLRIIKPEPGEYGWIRCPEAEALDGKLKLSRVKDNVGFYLNSSSWPFFAVGQIVRVFVEGKAKPGEAPLPREYIRADRAVSEDEGLADKIEALLSIEYLQKLELNRDFSVHAEVSFTGGVHFEQLVPVDIFLEA